MSLLRIYNVLFGYRLSTITNHMRHLNLFYGVKFFSYDVTQNLYIKKSKKYFEFIIFNVS